MKLTEILSNTFPKESLNSILYFLPYFSSYENKYGEFYEFVKPKNSKVYFDNVRLKFYPSVEQLNNNVYVSYSIKVKNFIQTIMDTKFIVNDDLDIDDLFNWNLGLRLIYTPELIKAYDIDTLRLLMSMIFYRSSHYEEYLLIMINKGIIRKILERLKELNKNDI